MAGAGTSAREGLSDAAGPWSWVDFGLLAVRLYLGLHLIWYALVKIGEPADFLKALREYDILPRTAPWLMNGLAVVLPWIELLGGAALLLGVLRRGVPLVLLLMLATFTAAVAWRARELQQIEGLAGYCEVAFDCGCGAGVVAVCGKLLENGLLVALCALLLATGPGRWTAGWLLRKRA
ncbi:MAG: DoxX family membrane protein [Planctomycetota bacterium]|nr:MAG: DoxX family membrane protein [Planctomycetota bacterium]